MDKKVAIATAALGSAGLVVAGFGIGTQIDFKPTQITEPVSNVGAVFFTLEENLPEGWKQVGTTQPDENKLIAVQSPRGFLNKDSACMYSYQVFQYPASYAGMGDEYISKDYLYHTLAEDNQKFSGVTTATIATDEQDIEFIKASAAISAISEEGADENDAKGRYTTLLVRGFDTTQQSSDAEKPKLPMAVIEYTCPTQKDASEKELKALLDGTTLNVYSGSIPTVEWPAPRVNEEGIPIIEPPSTIEGREPESNDFVEPMAEETKETDAPNNKSNSDQ